MFRYAHKLEVQRTDGALSQLSPLPHLYSVSYYQLSEELARAYPELTLAIFSGRIIELVSSFSLATISQKLLLGNLILFFCILFIFAF